MILEGWDTKARLALDEGTKGKKLKMVKMRIKYQIEL